MLQALLLLTEPLFKIVLLFERLVEVGFKIANLGFQFAVGTLKVIESILVLFGVLWDLSVERLSVVFYVLLDLSDKLLHVLLLTCCHFLLEIFGVLLHLHVLSHVLLDLVAGEVHRFFLGVLNKLEDGRFLLVSGLAKFTFELLDVFQILVFNNFGLDIHVHPSEFGVHGLKLVSQSLLAGVLLLQSFESDLGLSHSCS